ncbi:uncharacterized protein LOC131205480 [Anopheles bellator]|uniref:uncharacterized protein LOC131205480 n=1 Tax=Anopheles bellator TaxID=139047 RepID=UPI0026495E45|nr:uncharacterized protein LOC131205480 [Anopheles bellator]
MPDSSRTLGDIEDIDGAELKEQLKHWVEQEGIEANIQLQMKKNLIDKMSRTSLGRKIALKLQTQQGIVLSPLVLVLNTLVAEFLYTQNCHFSLSIFTNEVPFKNTLPDFTRSPRFRLDQAELGEIFEALGIDHYGGLVEKYERMGTTQGSHSLLYIVFKSILCSVKSQEAKLRRLQRTTRQQTNARALLKQLEVEKLHRNVAKLLHRVKAVGKGITQLEESHRAGAATGNPSAPDPLSKPADEDGVSLRVCSENVSRLVERLESCTKLFEQLIVTLNAGGKPTDDGELREDTGEQIPDSGPKSYTDFLRELKTTEHGKKYVAKLQKQIMKLLDKERAVLEAKYTKKVHRLELEHKEKLEKIFSAKQGERQEPSLPAEDDGQSRHFMRKIDEKLDQLHQQERNVDSKLANLRSDLQKQEQRQSRYFESLKEAKTKESKLMVLQNVERELLATFEDETNDIIQNAKATIEQLEKESDKINHSFQRYLQKQREDKRKLVEEKVLIWTRYNDEKLELNQRELLNGSAAEGGRQPSRPVTASGLPDVPMNLHESTDATDGFTVAHRFDNPFQSFDPVRYLRQARPIEHQSTTLVDVAIGTTADTAQQTSSHTEQSQPHERPIPAARGINEGVRLSEALAKDTQNLRQSIEENLQKLGDMSKTYTKSEASSVRSFNTKEPGAIRQGAHQAMPTVEPSSNRSLDDCSSIENGLSEGEVIVSHEHDGNRSPALDTTRDLLEYTVRAQVLSERADDVATTERKLPFVGAATSLSELSISTISKLSYEKSQSLDRALDRISTGARSRASENSWT